jgi:hypothetical protein
MDGVHEYQGELKFSGWKYFFAREDRGSSRVQDALCGSGDKYVVDVSVIF